MTRWLLAIYLSVTFSQAGEELRKFAGCRLVETEWADGDSFPVKFSDGKQQTIRLYGADCIEMHVNGNDSNARRLRDQRRYFGIADILIAKSQGETAKLETTKLLSQPFTVYTSFADGRGDSRFERIYGFVETSDGKNLAAELVSKGLARAFGVVHQLPDGTSGTEWREHLADIELTAARAGRGAWAMTDWEKLPDFRKQAREENSELETAKGTKQAVENKPVDINHASRDELMTLPQIGEKKALSIIEARPYKDIQDLLRAKDIGRSVLGKITPYIVITPP
ncbi:MAG: helix-hairpin-helix domain-containing protein [Luteolibacter sp.]|uniref:helix-hairpin-helix domain-containing protein n=1 Tax=Luteolibacter sp. TaxID=1962973 RepID=UPI003265409C